METNGIENILKATGLSCDDLIKKLLQYKTQTEIITDAVNLETLNYKVEVDENTIHQNLIKTEDSIKIDNENTNHEFVIPEVDSIKIDNEIESSAIHNDVIKPTAININNENTNPENLIPTEDSIKLDNEIESSAIHNDVINTSTNAIQNSNEEISSAVASPDDIRSIILRQIEWLRERRLARNFLIGRTTCNAQTFSKKRLSLSQETPSSSVNQNDDNQLNSENDLLGSTRSNSPDLKDVLLSNESVIKIVDVRGALDAPVLDNHIIKPTKTSDITKIKGWKNKKFVMNETNGNPSGATLDSSNVKSTENFTNNAFTSRELDKFLDEAALSIDFRTRNTTSEVEFKMDDNLYVKPVEVIKEKQTNNNYSKSNPKPRTLAEKRRALENMLAKENNASTNPQIGFEINDNSHVEENDGNESNLKPQKVAQKRKAVPNIFAKENNKPPKLSDQYVLPTDDVNSRRKLTPYPRNSSKRQAIQKKKAVSSALVKGPPKLSPQRDTSSMKRIESMMAKEINPPSIAYDKTIENINDNEPPKLIPEYIIQTDDISKPRIRSIMKTRSTLNRLAKDNLPLQYRIAEKNSYAYYNGEKVRILSKNPSKYIHIKETLQEKPIECLETLDNRKPTLLISPKINNTKKLTYSPGPLSKKDALQTTNKNKYQTFIKSLPEISLLVKPEIGKSFDPNILPYINFNSYDISDNRAQFALTALNDTNPSERTFFKFNIPYNRNQDKFKVYKKIYVVPIKPQELKPEMDTSEASQVINDVVTDMLNYVELKEISNDFIKDDDYINNVNDNIISYEKAKESEDNFEVISLKKAPKLNKTSLELKRLNVKIIEVDIENEIEADEKNCKNSFCRLGCVCKSLNGSQLNQDHCGNVDCMFSCNCKGKTKSSINAVVGSKIILPAGTNLLSNGTVNQLEDHAKKYLAKVEREFTQTVIQSKNQTIIVGSNLERKKRVSKAPKKLQDFVDVNTRYIDYAEAFGLKDCSVSLMKLDLSHIVPYCMIHKKHNCRCIGKLIRLPKNRTKTLQKIVAKDTPVPQEIKIIHEKIDLTNDQNEITENDKEVDVINTTKSTTTTTKKRKQTFDYIRTSPVLVPEPPKEPALQRRKKPKREIIITTNVRFFDEIESNEKYVLNNTDPFVMKLIVLSKTRGINKKFRMMPYNVFASNYEQNNLYIWCPIKQSGRILITHNSKMPEKNMVDIKFKEDDMIPLDFLKWLKNSKLPRDKNPDELNIVLMSTHLTRCWEIFGIRTPMRQTPPTILKEETPYVIIESNYLQLKLYSSEKEDKSADFFSLPAKKSYTKWAKLPLKSNFSYLTLNRFNVSIKYNILHRMSQEAFTSKKTLVVTPTSAKGFFDGAFAVYGVPECNDCVFIGPYEVYEVEDFDTLRYINGQLINTKKFDQMLNKAKDNKTEWMYTSVLFTCSFKSILCSEDFTISESNIIQYVGTNDCDYNGKPKITNTEDVTSNLNINNNLCQTIPRIKNKDPRYITSNVPSLGYVLAYISESSTSICWPEREKPTRFNNSVTALQWLKSYLEVHLTPLPLHFNIHLKIELRKPPGRKLLLANIKNFPYVGSFGLKFSLHKDFREELLDKKNMSLLDLEESMQRRTEKILLAECSQIYKDLSMSKAFATAEDFADCLNMMIRKETNHNSQFASKLSTLRQENGILKFKLVNLKNEVKTADTKNTSTSKSLIKPSLPTDKVTSIQDIQRQRKNEALLLLKENQEILIEPIPATKNQQRNNNTSANDTANNEEDEIICIDSDDELSDVVSVTPEKSVTNSFTVTPTKTYSKTVTPTKSNIQNILLNKSLLVNSNTNSTTHYKLANYKNSSVVIMDPFTVSNSVKPSKDISLKRVQKQKVIPAIQYPSNGYVNLVNKSIVKNSESTTGNSTPPNQLPKNNNVDLLKRKNVIYKTTIGGKVVNLKLCSYK